jgi:hypothetical protein
MPVRGRRQEVPEDDEILVLLNEAINRCLVASPSERPTAAAVNSKLADLIRVLLRPAGQPAAPKW